MSNVNKKSPFSNNKDMNLIHPLPNDEAFISNTIQIPKQFNQMLLEEGSSSNEEEPDASRIHSISSDNDDNSNNSNSGSSEKKEINSIFDFENIELPREEEHGDFRIITDFKIETLDSKEKKEKEKNKINKNKELKKEKKGEIKEREKILINKEQKNEKQIKEIIKEEESEEDDEIEDKMESWDLLKLLVLTKSKKKTSIMGYFKNLLSSIIYNNK